MDTTKRKTMTKAEILNVLGEAELLLVLVRSHVGDGLATDVASNATHSGIMAACDKLAQAIEGVDLDLRDELPAE